ncbi:MAG TPA: zf-HC2 domain-containing protein [Terriglobales bacterium]|nr:zf-HC2 domain-containing protein [Terriglobales bacterium]
MRGVRNHHERAFKLLCAAFDGSITEQEKVWLAEHLANCAECRRQKEQTQAAIAALKTVSISAASDLVQSTQRRVRTLCLQTEARQRRMRPIWMSSIFASAWMACTTPYLWQSFDLTGHWLHIPDLLWQMAFLVAWFTPALTGAAVAVWLRPQLTRAGSSQIMRATA